CVFAARRSAFGGLRQKRQKCKTGQPVLTHIVACDMGQGSVQMDGCGLGADGAAGVFGGQAGHDFAPAPAPAEVQTVQMSDLAVAAVADASGRQKGGGTSLNQGG